MEKYWWWKHREVKSRNLELSQKTWQGYDENAWEQGAWNCAWNPRLREGTVGRKKWSETCGGQEQNIWAWKKNPVVSLLSMIVLWCCFIILHIFHFTLPNVFFCPCLNFCSSPLVSSWKLLLPCCHEEQLIFTSVVDPGLRKELFPSCTLSSAIMLSPCVPSPYPVSHHQAGFQRAGPSTGASTVVSAHLFLVLGLPWTG